MSRLRAALSTSPIDQQILKCLQGAQRQVQEALALCDQATRDRTSSQWSKARRVRRDLLAVLAALEGVRRVGSRTDEEEEVEKPTPKVPEVKPGDPKVTWDEVG